MGKEISVRLKMKKDRLQSALFFLIIYGLFVVYIIKKSCFHQLSSSKVLLSLLGVISLLLGYSVLYPVFKFIIETTKKIGSLIFKLLSAIVYLFILTPISIVMRISGKTFMEFKIEKNKESYYLEYRKTNNIDKQY